MVNIDDLVKSLKTVTPAEAGVQNYLNLLDSRFRENDKIGEITTFYETINIRNYFLHLLWLSPFYFDLDLNWAHEIMRTPIIVDGRNVFERTTTIKAGFLYKGIGKGVRP